ncbi:MAG: cyclic nucleotide-binding domain-containing protein [Anaerolineae bacterium]|jgi:membrane protein YdbS with pleckstrin-like domain|nr:cyclic nucleotide-binding domain-containing protein [Anaerolineae bacterium]
MNPEQIVEHLQKIPLFKELQDKDGELELYHVARIVNEASYDAGAWLFAQGDLSDKLYLILEGAVRLTRVDRDGVTRQLKDVGPGDSFGLTGLLVGDFHDATAAALTEVRVLYLEHDSFADVIEERSRLRRRLTIPPELKRRQSTPDFKWLRPDELVVLAVRRHWANLVRRLFAPAMLLLILVPLLYFLIIANGWAVDILAVLIGLLIIGLVGFGGWQYIDWHDDNFVLTTQRIVHTEEVWPISQMFEESGLDQIQDIHEVQTGIAANLLNFGDVVLQTAGETVQIDLIGIAQPGEVREIIFREIERNRARDVLQVRGAIREKLASRLFTNEPPPAAKPLPSTPTQQSPVLLAVGAFRDYFFPPSWTVSADATTIYWRRFWLPGFVRYLGLFIPLALLTLWGLYFLPGYLNQTGSHWMIPVWLIVEGGLFGALLWFIEDWRNDYFEITPNRVIQVDRKPLLLQESRRETTLDRIQNITSDMPGIIARMLKYGHVMMETAGTMGKFELKWVRFPDKVRAEISKRQREYAKQQQQVQAQQRQEEMLSWFATYHTLKDEPPVPPETPIEETS